MLKIINATTPDSLIDKGYQEKNPEYQVIIFSNVLAHPDSSDIEKALAYYNRGVIHYSLKKMSEALNDFESCLEITPDDKDALVNAGLVSQKMSNYANALKWFDKYTGYYPAAPLGYFLKGNLKLDQKKYIEAVENYNQVLKHNPFFFDAITNRGWTFFFMKEYSKALDDFEKVLRQEPQNESAIEGKKQILQLLDNLKK